MSGPDTLSSLTAEYNAWLKKTGHKEMCALELLNELWGRFHDTTRWRNIRKLAEDISWLEKFIERWEAAEEKAA